MAVYRNPPTCVFCGKVIAKEIHTKRESWQPPIYGDSFIGWKYFKHNCRAKRQWMKANKQDKEEV